MISEEAKESSIELSGIKKLWNFLVLELWHRRLNRWIPRLVWKGDPIEVRITFTQDRLVVIGEDQNPVSYRTGKIYEAEKLLHEAGIKFDSGQGCEGRDWEFDYSLSPNVQVTFVCKK